MSSAEEKIKARKKFDELVKNRYALESREEQNRAYREALLSARLAVSSLNVQLSMGDRAKADDIELRPRGFVENERVPFSIFQEVLIEELSKAASKIIDLVDAAKNSGYPKYFTRETIAGLDAMSRVLADPMKAQQADIEAVEKLSNSTPNRKLWKQNYKRFLMAIVFLLLVGAIVTSAVFSFGLPVLVIPVVGSIGVTQVIPWLPWVIESLEKVDLFNVDKKAKTILFVTALKELKGCSPVESNDPPSIDRAKPN